MRSLSPLRRLAALGAGLLLVLGCMSESDDPGDGAAAPTEAQAATDFLVWSNNGRVSMTTWRGASTGVVHTRPDLVLPGAGGLWAWSLAQVEARALDCSCYDPYNLPASDAARAEHRARCARDATFPALVLTQLGGEGRLPVLPELPEDAGADPDVFEGSLTRTWQALGSVGPYLFLTRKDAVRLCTEGAKPEVRWASAVVDLTGPRVATLLAPSELARVEAEEKVEAAKALCVAPDCFAPKPDEVTLTRMRPSWTPDGKLVLKLMFTTPVALQPEDGAWTSGTRSVEMDARALPAALAPYAQAPGPVVEHWKAGPPESGGWSPVSPELRGTFGN